MAITYISTAAITEQSYPLKTVGNLSKTQVGVLAAQIATRTEQSKRQVQATEITGGWNQNGGSGECWVNQFEVAGVCVEKLNGTWVDGNSNFGGTWKVTNGTQTITGSWINNNQGESWDIQFNLTSSNGLTATGIITTTSEYTFSGIVTATNIGVQTVNPVTGIGKYGLTVEQLEEAGYLKAGTSDLVESGGITVCELYSILREISVWNCRQSLETFLASDQTPALVDVMKNTLDDLIAAEQVDCESTPAEVAAEILKAMYPEEDPQTLDRDAEYAINYAENSAVTTVELPDTVSTNSTVSAIDQDTTNDCDWIPTLDSEKSPAVSQAVTTLQNNLLDNLFDYKTPVLRDTPKIATDTYPVVLADAMTAIIGAPIPPANYTSKPAEKAGKC